MVDIAVVHRVMQDGYYNAAGNRSECTKCGYGLTTLPGAQAADTDCKVDKGFQKVGGVVSQCPVGELHSTNGFEYLYILKHLSVV
jgi:hypothetical protein